MSVKKSWVKGVGLHSGAYLLKSKPFNINTFQLYGVLKIENKQMVNLQKEILNL